jgi:hypothetical protein
MCATTTDSFIHPKKYVKPGAAVTTPTFTSEKPFSILQKTSVSQTEQDIHTTTSISGTSNAER